jgi:quercetin dioxygenase-like cupin family protein
MNQRHTLIVAAAAAIVALMALVLMLPLGRAGATPGSGVTSSIIARGSTDRDIHIRAKRPSDLVFARITLQPDGYTGWHTHPGPLLVVVESGTLTHYDRHCHAETYTAGEAFTEPAGRRHVHMGINKAGTTVVLEVTYIVPSGGPLRNEAPAPECAAKL